ncbi:LVIVD repeat-containing protein [Halovenus sp. HT40]|uniref:LVIVD repeat-containing protein n=1 Tax=Halovenus sp. HT40 TaxID=3126691 RepID=UPI00300E992F
MHRRRFLQAGGGVVAVTVLGSPASGAQSGDDATSLAPLGSVEVSGATDCTVQEEFAYIAADDGVAVVDISQPESPTVVAERRDIETGTGAPFQDVLDCWVWEDRLVVGGPGNFNPNSAHGFALYDITDPTEPEQLAFYETGQPMDGGFYIHNLYIDEGIVYLTGSAAPANPLVMVDVTGAEPEEVGRWSLNDYDEGYADVQRASRSLHDVTVQDGIAYIPCWDAGTWIVDVSDPQNPAVLASIGEYDLADLRPFSQPQAIRESLSPPGNAHYTMINDDGSLLAVGEEGWDFNGSGGPGGIDLYDVEDPADPQHLARIDPPPGEDQTRSGRFTSAHNFDFAGDQFYSSWYYGGVKIHDISEPSNPEEIGHWRNSEQTSFWTAEAATDGFVATSADVSKILRENPPAVREALYVFPDSPEAITGQPKVATEDSDGSGPGFGIPAAVGGALGGYWLQRYREKD